MNFDFGEVLVSAWKIIWKHKVLWIFGILASCGSRGGNSSSNSRNNGQGDPFSNEIMRDVVNFAEKAGQWITENTWVLFAFIGFILLLWIIQIFVVNIGQIGLIRGAYQADTGAEQIHFGKLFSESLSYFWRVVGLSLIVWLPIMVALIGIFAVFIFSLATQSRGGGEEQILGGIALFFLAFCCCLIPAMIALGLYYSQALRALVLEDLGIFTSLSRGWQVFSKNILGLILMGIVLFIINFILSIVIAVPTLIVILPLMFKFLEGSVDSWQPVILAIAILCLYSPIAWLLSGIIMSYIQTVWTLIYMRVTNLKKDQQIMIEAV